MELDQLIAMATQWIADDPDPQTRRELQEVVERARTDDTAALDLADRFAGRLEFGTAGLRGTLGAGPNRMNRVVVAQAAAGLAAYLNAQTPAPQGQQVNAVIGYDARRNSHTFAIDTAEILSGAGIGALLLPETLPTPVLAFAIRHLGAAAGVMVTASHNPPRDNGYKVYLGDGTQVVPPSDAEISAHIDAVGPVSPLPRGDSYTVLGHEVREAYVEAVAALPDPDGPRDLTIVYTPLHGVGASVVREVLARTGFGPAHEAIAQAEPDPDFPTVSFPNPEEPGVMDLAMALAADVDADVVVANDPDADRCAVAVPGAHGWQMLGGDEVGALLADHSLRHGIRGTYATTIVSSSLLRRMATEHGMAFQETLTGFKWIGRVEGLVFGYEEALGYAVAPHIARDKDGISALVRVLELAAMLKTAGRTLTDRLDEIAQRYGLHATEQLSVRVADVSVIPAAMQRLRRDPPGQLGGFTVDGIDDLAAGSTGLPPTEGLRFRLAEGGRVVVRPSGTEAKLKCYLEVVMAVTDSVGAARIGAAGRLDAIRADLADAIGLHPPPTR